MKDKAKYGVVLALVAGSVLSGGAFAADGDITAADYTSLATKILTYLGYAIAAGLTVLIAIIAAKAGWNMFQKFLKG